MSCGPVGHWTVTHRQVKTKSCAIALNAQGVNRKLIVPNPNCPECHGTGIYRGGLHGDSSPCSLCNPPEIPFGEGVTVAPEPPLPGNPPIIVSADQDREWDSGFLRTIWRESWLNAMNYKGSAINLSIENSYAMNTYGFVARPYNLRVAIRKLRPVSDSDRKELAHRVLSGVHAALPLAVWRTAPQRFPLWQDVDAPIRMRDLDHRHDITETVFINPDPIVNLHDITFHYYAEWVRR